MNKLFYAIFFIVSVIFIQACKSSSSVATTQDTQKEAFNGVLPVHVGIYHTSNSVSEIIITTEKKNLLYARKQSSSPFEAEIQLQWQLFKLNEQNLTHLDSSTVTFTHSLENGHQRFVQLRHALSVGEGMYYIKLNISDKRRKSGKSLSLKIDKSDLSNAQNFSIQRISDGLIVFGELLHQGDSVRIESARNKEKTVLHLFTFNEEIKLPPAPFSGSFPEFPTIKEAEHTSMLIENGAFNFKIGSAVYLVSNELLATKGLSFCGHPDAFPEVKNKNQLHPPLRYLTTKLEFESILKARNPKEKVDKFWVDCGGSKDRARDLIEEYYTRVEICNEEFSTFTEGWRTDRGMIYLVFGDPSKIIRTPTQETWIYGDEESPSSLRFQFKKLDNAWSDNIFVLNRDPLYKTHWERMVTAWRSGRIYTH